MSGKTHEFGARVQILALLVTAMVLGKLLHCSELQFSHLSNRNNNLDLIGLLRDVEAKDAVCIAKCLAPSRRCMA